MDYQFHNDLKLAKQLVYDASDLTFTNPKINQESSAYGACSFELNGKLIQYRISKITPTKAGQFVAIWKRNEQGITAPYDNVDLDFLIISSRSESNFGQFIFPKSVLAEKRIITEKGKEGKRGIRVYPPWDMVSNTQAEKTQRWQVDYFLTIKNDHSTDIDFIKTIFNPI